MPGFSIFMLWWAPVVILSIGVFVGVYAARKTTPKLGRGLQRFLFKRRYEKYARQQVKTLKAEFNSNLRMNKGVIKNKRRVRLNKRQQFLKKLGIYRFAPKNLSLSERQRKIKKYKKLNNYLSKVDPDYRLNNDDVIFENAKDYINAKRIVKVAKDNSSISSTNPKISRKFLAIVNSPNYKKLAKNEKVNTIYIKGKNKKVIESLAVKDDKTFFSLGSEIYNYLATEVPSEIFPIKVEETFYQKGKKQRREKIYSQKQIKVLSEQYKKQKFNTDNKEVDAQVNLLEEI